MIVQLLRWSLELAVVAACLIVAARPLPRMRAIASLSLASHLAVGLGFFAVSLLHLPFLQNLQLDNGLWAVAPDAAGYDVEIRAFADAFRHFSMPTIAQPISPGFSGSIAVTYLVFGASPGTGLIVNAGLAAGCALVAYAAARRLGIGVAGATASALIVGFFPSSFAWSGQLLKDTLEWFGLLVLLLGAAGLFQSGDGPRPVWRFAALTLVGAVITALVRGTVVTPILVASTLVTGVLVVGAHVREPRRWAGAAVFTAAVVLGSVPAAFGVVSLVQAGPRPISPTSAAVAQSSSTCRVISPLLVMRQNYVATGGGSQIDGGAQVQTCLDVIAYAPRALELVFVMPLPGDWFRLGATVGPARYLVGLDAIGLWLMLPGVIAAAIVLGVRRREPAVIFIVTFAVVFACVSGLVVANFGTLFRTRLAVIMALALLAPEGWRWLLFGAHSLLQRLGTLPSASPRAVASGE